MRHDRYESPLSSRYASDEMQYVFSPDKKFTTWRRLWVALARAEMELGLPVAQEQVDELSAHIDDIDYDKAAEYEKKLRHDVMAHVHTYGDACPKAMPIIHLGATSCYVGDNTDIIVMRQGLELVRKKLVGVLAKLARFAGQYKDMPCMAYTHGQPAQPTTVGKRATLWANELVMDLGEIEHRLATLQLRGVKGTTGTQASFMELFKGDADKIRAVDASIAREMGFDPEAVIPVSGQTYSRKVDAFILNALAGIAQSCMKFATDLRLLANFKEMEEPFEKNQIGSSAMPYKRNPMRCERICALARYLMVDVLNPSFTAGTQWFERTLDDSANRRISLPEAFLGIDAVLDAVGFDSLLPGTDVVFTGEGKIDSQSARGKVVSGVAARCRKAGVPVVAVVGQIGQGFEEMYQQGLTAVFSINRAAQPFAESRFHAGENLALTMENIARLLAAGR